MSVDCLLDWPAVRKVDKYRVGDDLQRSYLGKGLGLPT